jgi:ribosomal-protein-alanine N-acetyltransferase
MTRTTATLRPMHWSDIPAAHALEQQLFPVDAWTPETFWSELAHVPDTRCYLAAVDPSDALVGYAGVMTVADDADVQTVAVSPDVQGRGIGRLLLHGLLRTARDRGCRQVFLEVRSDNIPAIALYENEGFVTNGRRKDYYGFGVDALTMRRVEAS